MIRAFMSARSRGNGGITQIISAVKDIDAPMLTCVWQELEYCIDVYHVTRCVHTEHL
jgi:hypothetical protein